MRSVKSRTGDGHPLENPAVSLAPPDIVAPPCRPFCDNNNPGQPCGLRPAGPSGVLEAALRPHRLAGGLEVLELRDGAAEPDPACAGVDKAERSEPALVLAVDHEMGDGTSGRVHDHPSHFAAGPIGT